MKEATARIKINKLLESAGWKFFSDSAGPANIQLEPSVTLKSQDLDALGEDFEKAGKGFIDFLLLNEKGFPLIVLEAKAEGRSPLVGKEQARKYAKSQNCRFVILSNGNLHYFWDLERGNPAILTAFPTPLSIKGYQKTVPDPKLLIAEKVGADYVALTQYPGYAAEAAWKNEAERSRFIETNALRFLRPYQERAVYSIQQSVAKGADRFLLEMATGTGKTLVAAAIIKLFLRTGNAGRVLFLVDRLELEDQALKAFKKVLKNDFIAASVEAGAWDRVIDYVNKEVFDKPNEFYSLEKLRKAAAVDRRLTLREILEKIFGLIPGYKSKDDLLEEEFSKFVADYQPEEAIPPIKAFFKAYATDNQIRHIIETGHLTDLATNPVFSTKDFIAVPAKYRVIIPEYIKDYVSLNQFVA